MRMRNYDLGKRCVLGVSVEVRLMVSVWVKN